MRVYWTTLATRANVNIDDILQTAGWSSECCFARFYNKPIAKASVIYVKCIIYTLPLNRYVVMFLHVRVALKSHGISQHCNEVEFKN